MSEGRLIKLCCIGISVNSPKLLLAHLPTNQLGAFVENQTREMLRISTIKTLFIPVHFNRISHPKRWDAFGIHRQEIANMLRFQRVIGIASEIFLLIAMEWT